MDSVLQTELNGNRYEDVTIQQFVEEIWGLDPKMITDILARIGAQGICRCYLRYTRPNKAQNQNYMHPFARSPMSCF